MQSAATFTRQDHRHHHPQPQQPQNDQQTETEQKHQILTDDDDDEQIHPNERQNEELQLKDIIYMTLLRQQIDGSVFDADLSAQQQQEAGGRPRRSPTSRPNQRELAADQLGTNRRLEWPESKALGETSTVRVYVPELRAEIEIDCQLHDSFWHLKLCLVDSLLNAGQLPTAADSKGHNSAASRGSRRSNSIVSQLLSSRSSSSASACGGGSAAQRSSLTSRAKNVISRRSQPQTRLCRSSGGSLSSTDASSCSANAGRGIFSSSFLRQGQSSSATTTKTKVGSIDGRADAALYYGFSAINLSPWDDNARQSSELTEDEEAAVSALAMATNEDDSRDTYYCDEEDDEDDDDDDYYCDYGHYGTTALATSDRRISTLDPDFATSAGRLAGREHLSPANDKTPALGNRLFEQALSSGYCNYGFYSFSLAKFIDDQSHLTDYLSLVSSSSGLSYYLDLEFKLKQRQQAPLAGALNVINRRQFTANRQSQRPTLVSSTANRLSRLSFSSSASATNLTTISASTEHSSSVSSSQSFANNMIARLSAGGNSNQRGSMPQGAAQSKRKRSKLLDVLLNTNWSKQSQQSSNLVKLNKILLVCDANFLDEKSGESPLSLAISSSQINGGQRGQPGNPSASNNIDGCPPSASLFDLQCHSTTSNLNQLTLQQTNVAELSQSKAPLVERILLLLVKSGALIDFRNSDGRTPLHVAAMKSNFWALKTLLDLGASTDYRDINGLTPLYYSILHRADLKVTQLLLKHSKSPSAATDGLMTGAAAQAQRQAVGTTDQHGWQEVHQACKLGLDAHLEELLHHGCDMNAKISGSGNTPLHVAAINDRLHCAKVLLLLGADKTITNNSHQTPHQVAVISGNLDLAQFIAEHNESKVVPFRDHPTNFYGTARRPSSQRVASGQLVNSQSVASLATAKSSRATGLVLPQTLGHHHHQQQQQQQKMNPLALDVASTGMITNSGSSTNTSTGGHVQSLLSIGNQNSNSNNNSNQLSVHVNNISPCLSQRSCATSNTTSSSGICCDGDVASNSAEDSQNQNGNLISNSQSRHSNITIIAINNNNGDQIEGAPSADNISTQPPCGGLIEPDPTRGDHMNENGDDDPVNDGDDDDAEDGDEEDHETSGSSSNDLYSLMSEERPLFAGSIVRATSEYQSGDPSHLQLRRGDLVEVLEYTLEMLQAGQLPRLANKPMLYGQHQSDNQRGLFPSFCVERTKNQRRSKLRQKLALNDITNLSAPSPNNAITSQQTANIMNGQRQTNKSMKGVRGTNLPVSQSMASFDTRPSKLGCDTNVASEPAKQEIHSSQAVAPTAATFREIQVTLRKTNEGFGFVLRGARINPATLAGATNGQPNKVVIDERLMASNNLASLQYLDEIESGSVAHEAGLKRGDFLVAVNQQDVRLFSHEQVVHLIRQSGDRVHLTIASPSERTHQSVASKTLAKVKPEPPKRDPTTTLTRNRAQRVNSMIQQQLKRQPDLFDANKPLPLAPSGELLASPTGSLNMVGRSISTNLAHFHSAQSLASAADSHSISSVSTASAADQPMGASASAAKLQQSTPNHSSSSTATLTTIATMRPQATGKPGADQNSSSQSLYQPAVVTTTTRRTSPPNSSPPSDLNKATTVANRPSADANGAISSSVAPNPPAPPPPPPMPEFSPTQQTFFAGRLNQRRTSAPINQSAIFTVDGNRLLKKRESLAIVAQHATSASIANAPVAAPIPAQFGEVAAACAAAANSRLQRQQQQEKRDQQQPEAKIDAEQPPTGIADQKPAVCEAVHAEKPPDDSCETLQANQVIKTPAVEASAPWDELAASSTTKRPLGVSQPPLTSATLGRISSAQIIQQLKPSHHQQQHSQSQTLRAKPKRPAIPSYEELPPPPPPLPASCEESADLLEPAQELASKRTAPCQYHSKQHPHGQPNEHRLIYQQENAANFASSSKYQHQVQELLLKQQQASIMQNHQHHRRSHHHNLHAGHVAERQPIYQQKFADVATSNQRAPNELMVQQQQQQYQQHAHHHHHHQLQHHGHYVDRQPTYSQEAVNSHLQQQAVKHRQSQEFTSQQQRQLAKLQQQQLLQQQLRQQHQQQQHHHHHYHQQQRLSQHQQLRLQQQQQQQVHPQDLPCSGVKHAHHEQHNGHHRHTMPPNGGASHHHHLHGHHFLHDQQQVPQ